jgi:hypothetical protein
MMSIQPLHLTRRHYGFSGVNVSPAAALVNGSVSRQRSRCEITVDTILTPCLVPWAISPSGSGVTLTHSESDVEPECTVVFVAGRLGQDDRTDIRHVEIVFNQCYHARVGPHSDSEGVEALGYVIDPPRPSAEDYLNWRVRHWRETGSCPDSGFYVAKRSAWLESLPNFFRPDFRHYVVDGRDGYVELIAREFKWREWEVENQAGG